MPLTSGTINGIFFSYLKKEVLSITIVLFFVATLAYFFDISPPAENNAMSVSLKSKSSKDVIKYSSPFILSFLPSDFLLASKYSFFIGKFLYNNIWIIILPTAPVAPTTAILYFLLILFHQLIFQLLDYPYLQLKYNYHLLLNLL